MQPLHNKLFCSCAKCKKEHKKDKRRIKRLLNNIEKGGQTMSENEKKFDAVTDAPKVELNDTFFINPMWEIEIKHKGETLTKQPFCFMIHSYLKEFGFKPDEKTNPSIEVCLITSKSGVAKMNLFLNKDKFEKTKEEYEKR